MTAATRLFRAALPPLAMCFLWSLNSPAQDDQDAAEIKGKGPSRTRIGILGCLRQFEPSPALHRYLEASPDICLWVGDNIYADTDDDPEVLRRCYAALEARPVFKALRNQSTFVATWDDHDYGNNDEGRDYPLKDFSRGLFRSFWQMEEFIPEDRDGIYHVRRFPGGEHGLQIILLDPRYNRDDEGPEADTLGHNQWQWLEEQLLQPASLRLIVSGYQILLGADVTSETWDKFPKARQRLFDLIRATAAENVIFITGDQHYAEVLKLDRALDIDAWEFQFSGINQIEKSHYNPLRQTPVIRSKHSYCLLDIHWEDTETDVPHLMFQVFDALDNRCEIQFRLNFSDLKLHPDIPADRMFVKSTTFMATDPYPDLVMRYTLDDSDPGPNSPALNQPFTISSTTPVRLALFNSRGTRRSPIYHRTLTLAEALPKYSLTGARNGLTFEYIEGMFQSVNDAIGLKPLKTGTVSHFDVARIAGTRKDHYAIRFSGFIQVPLDEVYTFELTSDDGSRLTVHNRLVIDNDGSHSARRKYGSIPLEAGFHPFLLEYFEDYMGQELRLRILDPQGNPVPVSYATLHDPTPQ